MLVVEEEKAGAKDGPKKSTSCVLQLVTLKKTLRNRIWSPVDALAVIESPDPCDGILNQDLS